MHYRIVRKAGRGWPLRDTRIGGAAAGTATGGGRNSRHNLRKWIAYGENYLSVLFSIKILYINVFFLGSNVKGKDINEIKCAWQYHGQK